MSEHQIRGSVDAAIATFHLHVESRIAALCGRGYYTIGPCGEEAMSSAGHALYLPRLDYDPDDDEDDECDDREEKGGEDSVALHYRHLGISIVNQTNCGRDLGDVIRRRRRIGRRKEIL